MVGLFQLQLQFFMSFQPEFLEGLIPDSVHALTASIYGSSVQNFHNQVALAFRSKLTWDVLCWPGFRVHGFYDLRGTSLTKYGESLNCNLVLKNCLRITFHLALYGIDSTYHWQPQIYVILFYNSGEFPLCVYIYTNDIQPGSKRGSGYSSFKLSD